MYHFILHSLYTHQPTTNKACLHLRAFALLPQGRLHPKACFLTGVSPNAVFELLGNIIIQVWGEIVCSISKLTSIRRRDPGPCSTFWGILVLGLQNGLWRLLRTGLNSLSYHLLAMWTWASKLNPLRLSCSPVKWDENSTCVVMVGNKNIK